MFVPFIKSCLMFLRTLFAVATTLFNKYLSMLLIAVFALIGQVSAEPENVLPNIVEDVPKKFVIYMGHYAPYTYHDEKGEIAGKAVEMAKEIFATAGFEVTLMIRPWSRAISMFEGDPSSFLLMLDRVPEREDRYTWISPLADQRFKLISRKRSDFSFSTKEDIISGNQKAVCYQNSSLCEELLKYGFAKENLVEVPNSLESGLLRILQFGRADFTIMEERVLSWNQENYDGVWPFDIVDDVEITMCSYLVGHKEMPEPIKQKLITAVKALKFDLLDKAIY